MKCLIALVLSVLSLTVGAAEFGVTVNTSSVKVAPERGVFDATLWTNGMAVAQGQLVRYHKAFYMAETAIVSSTNTPYPGGSEFRALENDSLRESLVLCNASDNTIWLNIGGPARLNAGVRLSPGWSIVLDDIQASVFAISSTASLLTGVDVVK